MKKMMFLLSLAIGVAYSADKPKADITAVPDVQAQMEKSDKIESYRAKKDVAWHKTEYNKVLKYLNKKKK